MTAQGHLLGAKKLPTPGTPLPGSGPRDAFSLPGLGCVRAGVLISGDVIAEDTVAGLGGLSTRASARQEPEKPCSSSRCATGSDLSEARTAAVLLAGQHVSVTVRGAP